MQVLYTRYYFQSPTSIANALAVLIAAIITVSSSNTVQAVGTKCVQRSAESSDKGFPENV